MYDYNQLIREVIQPRLMETHYTKPLEALTSLFTRDPQVRGGTKITEPIRTSVTSNASSYNKSDVNPVSGTHTTVDAEWNKEYHHAAAEVHGIDRSQGQNGGFGGVLVDALQDAIALELKELWDVIYDYIYAQIKADIDSTATYSDAALNRTTYPTLASYEEATDTAITLALLRTCSQTVRLNKNTSPPSGYIWMMEERVKNVFEPLAAVLHTWNTTGVANQSWDAGYQPIGNWEGTPVTSPAGMTKGDVFFLRKEDVIVTPHRPLEISQDLSVGKDTTKFVMRIGINLRVLNPGFQGKMTDKD